MAANSNLTREETESLHLLVELALAEDMGAGDVTAHALVGEEARASGTIVAKADGIIAGLPAVSIVFHRLHPDMRIELDVQDGSAVVAGRQVARISGIARAVLAGERVVLNFLQHLSGVASLTRRFVDSVAGTRAQIFDTRKTTPAFRLLEKYAVRAGGGRNHRMGLYHEVLIKENHLTACGLSAGAAVRRAREKVGPSMIVEVEVETMDQFRDALEAEPDVIMLDDMQEDEIRAAAALRGKKDRPEIEVSGSVQLANVAAVAALGVDRISVGALTHSAPALDLSMNIDMLG
jgi:nicotinate-nucleotide pyrophosphorylase (carboxylating)